VSTAEGPPATAAAQALDRRLLDAVERLGHGLRALAHRSARAAGLSALQQQTLLGIAGHPPARRGVGALAAEFDVTTPTVSDAVAALVRKGLVVRDTAPDARRRVLGLTDSGAAVAAALRGWDGPALEALRGLDEHDKGAALDVTLTVIAALVADGTISVARTCSTCRHFRPDRHRDRAAPHHCALLELPLSQAQLRTDCPEHEPPPAPRG